jgi:ectoine hydroxylase-related dioxygenase (phytanoyl-CoA dioxygenase family)
MITFCLSDGSRHQFGEGDEDTVVSLDDTAWDEFRNERRTAFGLLYAGMMHVDKGRFEDVALWEMQLRKLWDGRPIYDASATAALDGIDLHRSFTLADSDDDMKAFLHAAGFIHVRSVFSMDEIESIRAEVERLRGLAKPDDGRSWWAKNADGEQVCCRLIYLAQQSDKLEWVSKDERLARIAALSGEHLVPADDRIDGLNTVIKNPSVVEGLSDLPWHQDCGLGGHPVLCPGLNIGIQLDEANAENGQLHILAGSHNHSISSAQRLDTERLPVVRVDTQPGDVTAHFGHITHAAPPPSSPTAGRRAMYVTFVRQALFDVIPEGRGYNDVLLNTPGQPSVTQLT